MLTPIEDATAADGIGALDAGGSQARWAAPDPANLVRFQYRPPASQQV
jgi:hypothetical protein